MIDQKAAFRMTLNQMADAVEISTPEEIYAMASEVERRIEKHKAQGRPVKKKLFTTLQLLSA